jgi:hypothetical protein
VTKKRDDKKKPRTAKDDGAPSPWLKGVSGVKGVTPPGRRLSPPTERRSTKWSASGVRGVTPPGKLAIGRAPGERLAEQTEKKRALREKAQRRAYEEAKAARPGQAQKSKATPRKRAESAADLGRPVAGARPEPFRDVKDPVDLKGFLDEIAEFFKKNEMTDHAAESLGELIQQSRAPYEITVAFTILSVIVGRSVSARRRHTASLERGAKTYFNLARRLDPNVKPPRGLVPETMDPIFFDLPDTAMLIPYAFGTAAFVRMLDLLRKDEPTDEALAEVAHRMYARYIEKRSLGDESLERMFPWEPPDWAFSDERPAP